MIKLLLSDINTYPWLKDNDVSFRGFFIITNKLYRGNDAINKIRVMLNNMNVKAMLEQLNGSFSIIIETPTEVWFATDRVRSLPLFYAFFNGCLMVADNAKNLYDELPIVTLDPISVEEFRASKIFVSGPNTLYKEIKQVQAGEWITYNKRTQQFYADYYYIHVDGKEKNKSYNELARDFRPIFEKASANLALALNGRMAVVPLSGGTDSREVLLMLKTLGYENVLCFTYGKKGNIEAQIAKKLAAEFRYQWLMVEYKRSMWSVIRDDPQLRNYHITSGSYACLPYIQDWLAVKYLKEKKYITDDAVFIPGHCGIITGGRLPAEFISCKKITYEETIEMIIKYHYSSARDITPQLLRRIGKTINANKCYSPEMSAAQYQCFMMKERMAKFIINSVRLYEYFGYEWLLPLCDGLFLDFMKTVPLSLKYKKKFIRDFMGMNSIPSTGDITMLKYLREKLRRNSLIGAPGRMISHIVQYYTSTNQMGGLYGFLAYLKTSLAEGPQFTSNALGMQTYLTMLREKKHDIPNRS